MNLTVDASVVIKWFVAESMSDEARLVLGHRVQLHAPELVVAEFANTIWKKARRKEVPDPGPYLQEIPALPNIIDLHPIVNLAERAAHIAFELDHSIYDCLYLACAEITDSDLITADRRFADKVAERLPGSCVHYLGGHGVADWLAKVTTAPVIKKETMENLIFLYEFFEETEQSVLKELTSKMPGVRILTKENQKLVVDNPAYLRVINLIRSLNVEERIDLLAIGWLGAGRFPDWRRSFTHAEEKVGDFDPNCATGYGHNWRDGYARVTGDG